MSLEENEGRIKCVKCGVWKEHDDVLCIDPKEPVFCCIECLDKGDV